MKAQFRVTLAGLFPRESNTPARTATVEIECDRLIERQALVALAKEKAPASTVKVRAIKIVLLDNRGDVISLAPKFGAEYQRAARVRTLEWLLADRCENYGYDWKDYRRIIAQRGRARAAAQRIACYGHVIDALRWDDVGSRLTIDDKRPEYCVGQSQNEEITGVLRVLAGQQFYPQSRD